MTGLEDSIKGKIFYQTENGEYQELEILKSTEIESQNEDEYINIMTDTGKDFEFHFEIKDKDTIRKLRQIVKTDKDKKSEKRFNKKSFRKFLSNKYLKRE